MTADLEMLRAEDNGSSDAPPSSGLSPRLLTTAALTCLVVVLVRVSVHAGQALDNADTWFHLSIGRELASGEWSLSEPGPLTSFATSPWVPTQWSTELAADWFARMFGLGGVAWLFGALFLGFIVVLYTGCRREGGPLPATVATGLAVIGAAPSLSARPQVVSLMLAAVVVMAWMRASRDLTPPWLLIPLTWVWSTAHGLWSAGVLIGVVCVVGIALDRRPDRATLLGFSAVPVLSVVAACLTPVGPQLITSQVAVGARSALIGEWQATSFRTLPAFVVAVMIAVVVMRWARRGQVAWLHLLLLLAAGGWCALVERMVGFGAVVAAPILTAALQELMDQRHPRQRATRAEVTTLVTSVAACLVGLALAAPHTATRPAGVPDGFSARLAALPEGSAVAVNDMSGSWIEWKYPQLNPMIDGMLDAYPVDYIQDYARYVDLEPGWRSFLTSSGARVAVLRGKTPLAVALERQLHWKRVDRDGQYVYLVAPGSP